MVAIQVWETHGRQAMIDQMQSEEMDLSPYYGKYVAWDLGRTRILASGDDDEEVERSLRAQNYPVEEAIFSYVTHPDISLIGGAEFIEPGSE
jgi:hypothetical protein